ncbi:hypothetical protein RCL1_000124 [Eukaryota sp. TZLM3-RCL]
MPKHQPNKCGVCKKKFNLNDLTRICDDNHFACSNCCRKIRTTFCPVCRKKLLPNVSQSVFSSDSQINPNFRELLQKLAKDQNMNMDELHQMLAEGSFDDYDDNECEDEFDDGIPDLTACDKDCGYCGQCWTMLDAMDYHDYGEDFSQDYGQVEELDDDDVC